MHGQTKSHARKLSYKRMILTASTLQREKQWLCRTASITLVSICLLQINGKDGRATDSALESTCAA
jgi:hypothetical protein